MKKKHRNITVNNTIYAWTIYPKGDKYEGSELKIWLNKKVIYDEWIDVNINITPKYIERVILEYTELKNNVKLVYNRIRKI